MSKKDIWKQPPALEHLLTELDPLKDHTDGATLIIVHPDEGTMTLTNVDVAKVLQSPLSVDQFSEAIEGGDRCMVEISGFETSPEVMDRLEELFAFVEEI
jgi:hypothetical protein